jgi:hypothetical protein
VKYLKEITEYDCGYRVPLHTYAFEYNKCVGYIPEGSNELRLFNKPSVQFSKKGRKFKEVKDVSVL